MSDEFGHDGFSIRTDQSTSLGLEPPEEHTDWVFCCTSNPDEVGTKTWKVMTQNELRATQRSTRHPFTNEETGIDPTTGFGRWTNWIWKSSSGNTILTEDEKQKLISQAIEAEKTEKAERAKQAKRERHTLVLRVIDENRPFFSPEGLDLFKGGNLELFNVLIDQIKESTGYLCDGEIKNIERWLNAEGIPHFADKTKTTLFIPAGQSKEMVQAIRIIRSCFEEIAIARRVEEQDQRRRDREAAEQERRKRRREERDEERAVKKIATSKTKLTDLFVRVMKQSNVKAMRECLARDEVKAAWDAAYESISSISE
jgi:transcription-repair coupling factor (superfamily II helicase)